MQQLGKETSNDGGVTMHKQTEKDKKFLRQVNAKLAPVLRIVQSEDRNFPHFRILLCETKYAMMDQVTVEWDVFPDLVNKVGRPIYGIDADFNNTGSIFYFYGC